MAFQMNQIPFLKQGFCGYSTSNFYLQPEFILMDTPSHPISKEVWQIVAFQLGTLLQNEGCVSKGDMEVGYLDR